MGESMPPRFFCFCFWLLPLLPLELLPLLPLELLPLGCQAQNILQSHARIFIANLFHKLHPCFGCGIGLNHFFIRFVYVFMPKGEKIYLKPI